MASSATPNFNLCQWEPTDPVVRTDFNEDNEKIDAAIQATRELAAQLDGKIDSAAQASQTRDTQLDSKINSSVQSLQGADAQLSNRIQALQNIAFTTSNLPFAAGAYAGDGASYRTIYLGFTPRAVLVMCGGSNVINYSGSHSTIYGGLAVTGHNASMSAVSGITSWENYNTAVAIVAGGFQVSYMEVDTRHVRSNQAGQIYQYIALK